MILLICSASAGVGAGFMWMIMQSNYLRNIPRWAGKVPHPSWKPVCKQPLNNNNAEFISCKPSELKSRYSFAISSVIPRPIGLIGTISEDGIANLSPFSYFGLMGHDPLAFAFTCVHDKRRNPPFKDTLANIKQTGECTVQIMSSWFVEAANHTCGNWPPSIDEFELSGLTKLQSLVVKAPRVGEAAVQFECKVLEIRDMKAEDGTINSAMIIVEAVMVHVNKDVYDETSGTVKGELLDPISRLGGCTYGLTRETFDLSRPVAN